MCGLIGVAGQMNLREEKVFKTLLTLDIIRGKHSTGVASLSKVVGASPVYTVAKDKLNAVDFMDKPEFSQLMAKNSYILMGHNRWATVGEIIQENAHPFEFENVIGAHNGSLYHGWKDKLFGGKDLEVDSMAIYSELNNSDVVTMWSKLNGPAALTWMDKRDNTLHWLRNKDRPLFYVTANAGKTLLWASEPWMLHVAAGREDLKLDEAPRELPVNTHFTWSVPTVAGQVLSHTRETVTAYVAPKWQGSGTYQYQNPYQNQSSDEALLKKEDVKVGETLEFYVTQIKDFMDGNIPRATVIGKTLRGTPVMMFGVNSDYHDELLLSMWDTVEMLFQAKVKYAGTSFICLDVHSTECLYYTVGDVEEAMEKQALAQERKLLAASSETDRSKLQ